MSEEAIFCPSCGEVLEGWFVEELSKKEDAMRDLEKYQRTLRAQLRRLRNDRNKQPQLHPRLREAEEVYAYWKARLAPEAREFKGDRFDAVVGRLEAGHGVEDIKKAIDGCAAFPFVARRGGRTNVGNSSERQVELELICRDDSNLLRFMRYADGQRIERTEGDLLPASRVLAYQSHIEQPRVLERLHALRGWTAPAVLELGVGLDPNVNRVVFFLRDAKGRLTGVARYQPNPAKRQDGVPKLLAMGAREMFPAPETVKASSVWLVEGEPDAVAARSAGYPAVSVPGVAAWKEGWAERFEPFDQVYVCFDCDDEGREAAAVRVAQLGKLSHAIPVDLDPGRDDGYDIGDLLIEHGERAASMLSSLARTSTGQVRSFQPRLGSEDPYAEMKKALKEMGCRVSESKPGQATSQCPNHDDRHPSLSLAQGDDGRVLAHCHAGCTFDEILAALKIEGHEAFKRRAG